MCSDVYCDWELLSKLASFIGVRGQNGTKLNPWADYCYITFAEVALLSAWQSGIILLIFTLPKTLKLSCELLSVLFVTLVNASGLNTSLLTSLCLSLSITNVLFILPIYDGFNRLLFSFVILLCVEVITVSAFCWAACSNLNGLLKYAGIDWLVNNSNGWPWNCTKTELFEVLTFC